MNPRKSDRCNNSCQAICVVYVLQDNKVTGPDCGYFSCCDRKDRADSRTLINVYCSVTAQCKTYVA